MPTLAISGSLLMMALASASGAAANGPASGTFASEKHAVKHGVAWQEEPLVLSDGTKLQFVTVVLSAKPFDGAAMARDGSYDDSDLMAHDAPSLTIKFNSSDGSFDGIRTRDKTGSGGDFRCEGPGLLTLTKNTPTLVAGTFKCEEHNVTFEAPLLKAAKRTTP